MLLTKCERTSPKTTDSVKDFEPIPISLSSAQAIRFDPKPSRIQAVQSQRKTDRLLMMTPWVYSTSGIVER